MYVLQCLVLHNIVDNLIKPSFTYFAREMKGSEAVNLAVRLVLHLHVQQVLHHGQISTAHGVV